MRDNGTVPKRWGRWLMLAAVAVCATSLGGCCCTTADHTITILDVDGDEFVDPDAGGPLPAEWQLINPPYTGYPDDSIRLHIEAGQTICFVNTTGRQCKVEANVGTYTEGHIFTVAPNKCEKRTIAEIDVGTELTNTIICSGLGHGAPGMIVVPTNHTD